MKNVEYLDRGLDGYAYTDTGEVWGYIRVSTAQQNTDRQDIALSEYGVNPNHIFVDKYSGKTFNRPAYKQLVKIVRKGDIIVIQSLDRLGRNYQDIIDQWRMLTMDIGCGIHVLNMPMLNTSGDPADLFSKFITDLMLQVLSFVAENERSSLLERQKAGIAAAKAKKRVKIGRPKKPIPYDFWEIYIMYRQELYKTKDLIQYCKEIYGISSRTFYRRIYELDNQFGDIPSHRLHDVVSNEMLYEGFEFATERQETVAGIQGKFSFTGPIKDRYQRRYEERKKIKRDALLKDKDIVAETLKQRQAEFMREFNITDESADYLINNMNNLLKTDADNEFPDRLVPIKPSVLNRYRKKKKKIVDGTSKKLTSDYTKKLNKTKIDAGSADDAVILIDTNPVIPEVKERPDNADIERVKANRTTIITD